MDKDVVDKAQELAKEIGDVYQGSDWLVVKKYVLKYLNPKFRKFFSKRDDRTKKHTINNFESNLIDFYENKFNIRLVLDEDKQYKN